MGDTPIRISQLDPGDKISAIIVTEGKPEILTAQAVDAQLAAIRNQPRCQFGSQRNRRPSNRRRRRPRQSRRPWSRNRHPWSRRRKRRHRARAVAEALYEQSFLLAHRGDHHPGIGLGARAQEGQEGRAEIAVSVVSSGFRQSAGPGGTAQSIATGFGWQSPLRAPEPRTILIAARVRQSVCGARHAHQHRDREDHRVGMRKLSPQDVNRRQ